MLEQICRDKMEQIVKETFYNKYEYYNFKINLLICIKINLKMSVFLQTGKATLYKTNGTGRDSYIYYNSGGF